MSERCIVNRVFLMVIKYRTPDQAQGGGSGLRWPLHKCGRHAHVPWNQQQHKLPSFGKNSQDKVIKVDQVHPKNEPYKLPCKIHYRAYVNIMSLSIYLRTHKGHDIWIPWRIYESSYSISKTYQESKDYRGRARARTFCNQNMFNFVSASRTCKKTTAILSLDRKKSLSQNDHFQSKY